MHKMPANAEQENNNRKPDETSCGTVSQNLKTKKDKDNCKNLRGKTSEWRDKSKPADKQMNISYQRDTKKAKTQGHQTTALPSIKGMCWNVRGLTTVLEELEKLAHDHNPDFIVITETKLRIKGRGRQRLAAAVPDYRLHISCKKDGGSTCQGECTGAAGVATAVHRRLTRHASVWYAMLNSPAAAGHCQAGSDALDVWGVYMPHDIQERQQVYQLLRDHIAPDRYTVMAGDMNAADIPADRANGVLTPSYQAHQKLLENLNLAPTDIGN